MAFKKVCRLEESMAINGSLVGYFFDPLRTECSIIWAMPLEFVGGVLKPIPKVLFVSSFLAKITFARVFVCLKWKASIPRESKFSFFIKS